MDVNTKLVGGTLDYAGLLWATLDHKYLVVQWDVAQRTPPKHSFLRLPVMRAPNCATGPEICFFVSYTTAPGPVKPLFWASRAKCERKIHFLPTIVIGFRALKMRIFR